MTVTYDLTNSILDLRLIIGDTDNTAYRYLDEWLEKALILAIKKSQKYFNYKYLLDGSNLVYRNSVVAEKFVLPEPPVLEPADEYLIILFAALNTLEGSLENSAWDTSSWKDAEISYSNLEGARTRNATLSRLLDEIHDLIIAPTKRLAWAKKNSLPGFKNNLNESDGKW